MRLNRSQRMQIKAFICLFGILLLLILLIWKVILSFQDTGDDRKEEEEKSQEIPEPVVEFYQNVWVMSAEEDSITVFLEGKVLRIPFSDLYREKTQRFYEETDENMTVDYRDTLADVEVTDKTLTALWIKDKKINGKLLSASSEGIELEGYGVIPLAQGFKGYRSFGDPVMCSVNDLTYGYNFADFIVENGEIAGFFIDENKTMENIRVLVKTSDFSTIYHKELILSCKSDFSVTVWEDGESRVVLYNAGDQIDLTAESELLQYGRIRIESVNLVKDEIIIKNLTRSQKMPSYRGVIEIIPSEEGMVVVNELLLEEYLYSVVPSEMPGTYPEEALKAQAVSARTYAYNCMLHAAYPQFGAHLDDSTSYQVYNNIDEKDSTTLAVKQTFGKVLYSPEGEVAEIFYYSTSCGVGSDPEVWKTPRANSLDYMKAKVISLSGMTEQDDIFLEEIRTEEGFRTFILGGNDEAFEKEESWFRWTYSVRQLNVEEMFGRMIERQKKNSSRILVYDLILDEFAEGRIRKFDEVYSMKVTKRGGGGVCDEMIIDTSSGSYKIISEQNIRYILSDGVTATKRQDGKSVVMPTLLPSAFFVMEVEKVRGCVVGYTLRGGGYGHGAGMSQNGAKNMALAGFSFEEILDFFYEDCVIQKLYEE